MIAPVKHAEFIELVKAAFARFGSEVAVQEIWSELRRRVLAIDDNTIVNNLAWRILRNAEYHAKGEKVYNSMDESIYI